MKKITALPLITVLSLGSVANAGTMGPIEAPCCLSSFISLEGGYSWNQIDGYNFNLVGTGLNLYSRESDNGFTGRLAAGFMRSINDTYAVTSEIGYGYYGRTTLRPRVTGLNSALPGFYDIKHTLSGFDALAGIAYTDPNYSIFLKAGALVQNMTTKVNANFGSFGISDINAFRDSTNHTGVLPELKVGGAYNVASNWAITASYLHAFGSSPRDTGNINVVDGSAYLNTNTQNPSIDSVLLGIQYTI